MPPEVINKLTLKRASNKAFCKASNGVAESVTWANRLERNIGETLNGKKLQLNNVYGKYSIGIVIYLSLRWNLNLPHAHILTALLENNQPHFCIRGIY